MVGQPLKLEAQVLAFPNPQVQWFKDGIPLRHTKEMNFINEPNGLIGLKIDYVRPEDAGTYSLIVSNALGDITGTAKVEVEEREKRPEFVASLQSQTVVEGFPVKMEVKTSGKPTPELQWLRNGDEVHKIYLFYYITNMIFRYYFINTALIMQKLSSNNNSNTSNNNSMLNFQYNFKSNFYFHL